MPIHGIGNRVPLVGYIKIGEYEEQVRKTSKGVEWRKPQWLGHFKITTMERDKHENLIADEAIMSQLPDKPTRIEGAILIGSTVDDVMEHWYKYHPGKRLACQGDGQQATKHHEDGTQEVIPCPCPFLNKKQGGCKASGRLHVMLPKLAGLGGVYALATKGITIVDSIVSALKWEAHMRQQNPNLPDHAKGLMGLECTLTHVMKTSGEGFAYPMVMLTITGQPGRELGGFTEPIQIEASSAEVEESELADQYHEFTPHEVQKARAEGTLGEPAPQPETADEFLESGNGEPATEDDLPAGTALPGAEDPAFTY